MTNGKEMTKIKNKKNQNKKDCPHTFYFLKVKSILLISFLCYSFVETIFRKKLNTLVTKYMDTLTFNCAQT